MPVSNLDIARMLRHVADLLYRAGADRFRVYAWRHAAESVERASAPVSSADRRRLRALPGVGDRLAAAISDIARTGSLPKLDELPRRAPTAWRELARVDGIGPVRARRIAERLEIGSLDELRDAARAGRLRSVKGIGAAIEARVAAAIERSGMTPPRLHRGLAERSALPAAEAHRAHLGVEPVSHPGGHRCEAAPTPGGDSMSSATPHCDAEHAADIGPAALDPLDGQSPC